MKTNKKLILVATAVIGLASCQTELRQPTEAEIDAKVQEKVEQTKAQLQEQCDTDILAAANMEADRILVAAANRPAPAPAAAPRKKAPTQKKAVTKKTPAPKPKPKTNPKADRFNNKGGKKTVTTEQTKKKAERFNGSAGEKKTVTPEQTKKKGDRFRK